MHLIHGTSLLSTPLSLWTSIITLGKKIDDEKTLLLKIIWLYLLTGTCLQHAVYLDNLEFVRYFFQQRNDDQEYDQNITYDSALPPIFIACSNLSKNSLEIVRILLDQEQTRIDMTIQAQYIYIY